MISIIQIKAARVFLGWDQAKLATKLGISLPTIQRIENPGYGPGRSRAALIEHLRATFEAEGIEFLEADQVKGGGLRFAKKE